MSLVQQRRRFETTWAQIPGSIQRQITLEVLGANDQTWTFNLGLPPLQLSDEEVKLVHRLWLSVSQQSGAEDVRHHAIVVAGLHLLEHALQGSQRTEAIELIKKSGERKP